jgi:DNA-binding CsgD family transcriptional regulator
MFFFFPLNFHFAYSVSFKKKLPAILFVLLYGSALFLTMTQFIHPISMKIITSASGEARVTQAVDSPLNLVWMSYALLCWLFPAGFFLFYRQKTSLNREKKQATLLVIMIIIIIFLVLSEYYLLPIVPGWRIPSQSPLIFSFWIGTMVYAIWKYGFLRISPEMLTEKILDSVEDLVLLYSAEGEVVYKNRRAKEFLGEAALTRGSFRPLDQAVRPIFDIKSSWKVDSPEKLITLKISGIVSPNITKTHPGKEKWETVKFRLKPLLDKFGDPLGVLVSGTVLPKFKDLLKDFHLSLREQEVLEYIMAGWTIGKTAETLFITERTVKAHISSIYEKTGAGNRLELANLVLSDRPTWAEAELQAAAVVPGYSDPSSKN